jgi:hypothetical protein
MLFLPTKLIITKSYPIPLPQLDQWFSNFHMRKNHQGHVKMQSHA